MFFIAKVIYSHYRDLINTERERSMKKIPLGPLKDNTGDIIHLLLVLSTWTYSFKLQNNT